MNKKRLTTIAFLLGMGILPNAHAATTDGLVAHWSFDDCKATDNSGNGHDGTLNGNPQCVDGVKGKAFSFDGVDDYIHVPLTQDLKFNQNIQSFSATIWAKPIKMNFFDSYFSSVTFGADFIDTYTYLLTSYGFEAKRNPYTAEGGSYATAPLFDKDNWHLFSGVWKVNGNQITAYFYIDGVLSATKNLDAIPNGNYPWNGLFIGATAHLNGGRSEFFGDDIRIYNRALTEAEVLELYKGEPAKPQTADLNMSISAPSSVSLNQKNTYTFTINNPSKITAKGVKVNFVVPRKAFATVEIPQNCTLNGRVLECKLSDLSAGQSATQTLSMSMLKKGALSVVGLVNFNADDANYDDNKVSAVVSVK